MFRNWFSVSPGVKLKSRSRPANKPNAPSSSRNPAVPTSNRVSNSHGQRRNVTATTANDIAPLTTKKTHTSIVVRRDGNVEVVTPRATVVLPDTRSSQAQRRSSATKATTPIITASAQPSKQGHRELMQRPKRPHSSSSDRLPSRLVPTDSRPRTSHRSGSYNTYERDRDYTVSSYKEPPHVVQVPSGKYVRRGSYPLTYMPSAYVQEPTPAYPEMIYQPMYSQPPSPQRALYPNPTPRPRRSLSNADSISSHYSDYSNTPPPRGWYNRRGDQYMRKGVVIMQPPDRQWHPVFSAYPDVGKGYMDENGQFLRQAGGILKGGNKISLPSDIIVN